MAYTKTTWVNNNAPYLNETNLNKIENGIFNNDAALGNKIDTVDGSWVGTLSGDSIIAAGTTMMLDRYVWETNGAGGLQLRNTMQGGTPFYISLNASPLNLSTSGLFYNNKKLVEEDAYATDTTGGTIKILVSGTDCYITTDGSTPGA